ncbi:glycosyltransferase family 2 protein [Flavobacterium sp. WC2430]|uniref:glycosyltransferase family 2 protein n=1 Tax=Flavobacterium sp. WC2430 TaxID=3234137 RepID=UPI0034660CC1
MIIIYHNKKTVQRVDGAVDLNNMKYFSIGMVLFNLAKKHPDEILVWCDLKWESYLNIEGIKSIIHHKKMMVSYNPYVSNLINNNLGYVDNGSILRSNKEVTFLSWQMSDAVGVVYAEVLNAIGSQVINRKEDFGYLLNSLAKRAMPMGLFCYSDPRLFNTKLVDIPCDESSNYILFKFVKQHLGIKWIFVLFASFLIYERKIKLFPFFFSFFFKSRKWDKKVLDIIQVSSNNKVSNSDKIDVIIPTIGRAKYLKDVLYDLREQSHLPNNVIIVEQNPQEGSVSELSFIYDEKWPFKIEHIFTHQAGACNARNIALSKVTSEWVFLNDDDNKLEKNVIKKAFKNILQYGVEAIVTDYPQTFEINSYDRVHQTTIFGSGNSIIKSIYLKKLQFNSKYEFGYGEDFDFGMQLRNSGVDVIYFPEPTIIHLKAPMGGFRIKSTFLWSNDAVVPKPSPTVMLNNLVYRTQQQLLGYKTVYFYTLFKVNIFQNPIWFLKKTNAHWNASVNWATMLKNND